MFRTLSATFSIWLILCGVLLGSGVPVSKESLENACLHPHGGFRTGDLSAPKSIRNASHAAGSLSPESFEGVSAAMVWTEGSDNYDADGNRTLVLGWGYDWDVRNHLVGAKTEGDDTESWPGPFGEVLKAYGPIASGNPWRYGTKYFDEETQLSDFGFRYFDAPKTPLGLPAPRGVASEGGVIRSFTQQTDQTYYRVFSGNQQGAWLTARPPGSSAFAREALALPAENTASLIQKVVVPAGTRLQRSRALPAFGRRGGGEQFRLLEEIPAQNFGTGVPLR